MRRAARIASLAAAGWSVLALCAARPSDGGIVTRPESRSAVWFVNVQGIVEVAFVREVADEIGGRLQLPVRTGTKAGPADGAAILLEERADAATLTIEPEGGRAKVNVRALAADGATAEKLRLRVRKEMWRAVIYLLGGGNSAFPHCVMKPVASLEDLDDIEASAACPEPFNRVLETAGALGIRGARSTTYRRACEEGWAPPPTNEAQTAIWERVKSDKERGPANAIRILPPNARR